MNLNQNRILRLAGMTAMAFAAVAMGPATQETTAGVPKLQQKKSTQKQTGKTRPKLTHAEARFLKNLERKLVTKLNSKSNPADKHTWYVLLLLDRAVVQKDGASKSGSTLSVTRATWMALKPDGIVVQGRREAALALARFLFGVNNAAKGFGRLSTGQDRVQTRAAGDKRWRAFYFKTEKDAKTYLAQALPPKKKK